MIKKNINVLMVTGVYFPEVNGAVLQCKRIVSSLKNKITFSVLTTTRYKKLADQNIVDGVNVFRPYAGNYIFRLLQVIKIFQVFLTRKIDIVHLHGFSSRSALILLISKLFNKKVIVKMTSFGHDDAASVKGKGRLFFYIFSLADMYIGVSPIFKSMYLTAALNKNKYHQIPNGVETNLFKPLDNSSKKKLRAELGLPIDMKLVLVVGHFSIEKSMNHVLDAWLNIQESTVIKSGVVFIGSTNNHNFEVDGNTVNSMHAKSKPFIGKKVFFIEGVSNIEQYYQSSDIYVLSSSREGLPNTLLEAMSCALPVVSTRLPGITDWVVDHQDNGIMYDHGDIDALECVLKNLLENDNFGQKLGVNARATIKSNFDISSTVNKIHNIYEDLHRLV